MAEKKVKDGTRELISVVVTTKNEAANIRDLLDSLITQEPPVEIIIIDAASTDGTQEIVKEYMKDHRSVFLHQYAAQRGESRNMGIQMAKGSIVAFTDGDCITNPFWAREIRKSLQEDDIVGGRTMAMGYEPFRTLGRVEVYYKGFDITFPSCNLAYRKHILDEIGGFDPRFVTAEDVDLNYRAVDRGYHLIGNERMVVYHKERSTIIGFFKQAFWNGFGRKQLTKKHGSLWSSYDPSAMLYRQIGFWWLARTIVAFMGYFSYLMAHRRYKVHKA
ncbi:MAG: glycosyltransferase [Candidatus Thermoplasmatota archaeon]|nr:glycosyltransferase [Candidatus Thermoplasmatota archaeon]